MPQDRDEFAVFMRSHLEQLMAAHEALDNERHLAIDRRFVAFGDAQRVFAATMEQQRSNSNEWRQAMNDREQSFARQKQVDVMENDLGVLRVAFANMTGRASQSGLMISLLLGAGGLLLGLLDFLMRR